MKVMRPMEVQIPGRPNFIRVGSDSISIHDFTDEELNEIGRAWTKLLLEEARRKRQNVQVIQSAIKPRT